MQNLSYENEFDLHENEPLSGTYTCHEWFCIMTGFDTDSEMAFCKDLWVYY